MIFLKLEVKFVSTELATVPNYRDMFSKELAEPLPLGPSC